MISILDERIAAGDTLLIAKRLDGFIVVALNRTFIAVDVTSEVIARLNLPQRTGGQGVVIEEKARREFAPGQNIADDTGVTALSLLMDLYMNLPAVRCVQIINLLTRKFENG
jgi:hypothetical protein